VRLRVLLLSEIDPPFRIRKGVGVWEAISQSPPDLAIVSVANQRGLIAIAPRSKHAVTAVESHALILDGARYSSNLLGNE
jgi:hypothetical protein